MAKLFVQSTNITIISFNGNDHISLTELAKHKSDEPNAVYIEQGMPQSKRLMKLNQRAIHQMDILEKGDNNRKLLK